MPRRIRFVTAALLAAVTTFTPNLSASASVPSSPVALTSSVPTTTRSAAPKPAVTFGLQPAQKTKPDQRSYFSFGVTPGAKVTDHIAVINYSPKPLTLAVYATDATTAADGGITFDTAAIKPVDSGSWITVGHTRTVTVPARKPGRAPGSVILPLTVSVPPSADPGDHVAAIIASLVVQGTSAAGTPVRFDQRVAERVYTRVSGTLNARLRVEHLTLSYPQPLNPFGDVTAKVSYTVHNTGNLLLSAAQGVAVSGLLGGTKHAPALPDILGLLPGASLRFSTVVHHVAPGFRLTATVTLHPRPAIAGHVDGSLSPVRSSTSGWAWVLTLSVLVLVALIGLWIWRRYWVFEVADDEDDDIRDGRRREPVSSGRSR